MTVIKLCGLKEEKHIEWANALKPEYIGFVFFEKSKRYVSPETAKVLKPHLNKDIKAVGVFVDEDIEKILDLLNNGIIDAAQLHGHESYEYVKALKEKTDKQIIQAFKVDSFEAVKKAEESPADLVLLDSGAGSGVSFDLKYLKDIKRPYLLAGGLSPENVRDIIETIAPYGVDVSSGIEENGVKTEEKMYAFVKAVRKE